MDSSGSVGEIHLLEEFPHTPLRIQLPSVRQLGRDLRGLDLHDAVMVDNIVLYAGGFVLV